MDGVFFIDKPKGITSRDAVNFLMKKFSFKKMGHVGTLDPFATGLLLVVTGKATKIGQFLECEDKVYTATLVLGEARDTQDEEGEVIETKDVPDLTLESIQQVLNALLGKQMQTPPMFSAIKKDGVPLYMLARKGVEVERKQREIEIKELKALQYENHILTFRVHCSKGTYVRTLGVTIAEKLKTVGYLCDLRREKVGNVSVLSSKKLEEVTEHDLHSIKEAMSDFPSFEVPSYWVKNIKDGKKISLNMESNQVLFTYQNEPLAVYEKEHDFYRCVRGLWS